MRSNLAYLCLHLLRLIEQWVMISSRVCYIKEENREYNAVCQSELIKFWMVVI